MTQQSVARPVKKVVADLAAAFALAGHELHVIGLADGRQYYEVRRWGSARMFSTLHGVQAFLTQIGGSK
jgi:hypothetical protein